MTISVCTRRLREVRMPRKGLAMFELLGVVLFLCTALGVIVSMARSAF